MEDEYLDYSDTEQLIESQLDILSPYPDVYQPEVSSTNSSPNVTYPTKTNSIKSQNYPGFTDDKDLLNAALWEFHFLPENEFDSTVKENAVAIMENYRSLVNDYCDKFEKLEKLANEKNGKSEFETEQKDAKIKKLEAEKWKKDAKIEKLESEMEQKGAKIEDLEAEHLKKDAKIQALENRIVEMNEELISFDIEDREDEKTLQKFNDRKTMLELIKENDALKRKNEKMKKKFGNAEFEIKNQQDEIQRYKEYLSIVESGKQQLRNSIKSKTAEFEEKKCQFDKDLKNAAENCNKKDAKIQEMQTQHKKDLEELKKRQKEAMEKMEQENEHLKVRQSELIEESKGLLNKMDKTAKKGQLFEEKCKILEIDAVEKEKSFDEKLDAAKNENNKLQEKLKDAEKNVDEMGEKFSDSKIEASEKEKSLNEELRISKNEYNKMKSKLAELHQRHSTRLITSFEAEKVLNQELNAANLEIEKLKSNLKMADEDNMKMRKQNVELKVESDEMKRRLKSITDKTAATKSPKKNAFDSEIIEDPTMTDTSTKGVADSEEAVENVKDQIATDKTTLGDPKKAFCVETESIIIDKEANEINDMNQIFEGLKNATAYLDENEIPFDKSTSYVAKLRSTLSFLTLEYQKIHKKLEESEASVVKVNSEKQNLETEIAMLQKKLSNSKTEFNELRSAYLRTPQIENFQNVNRENAALKAKIQEERNATTLKIAQLVQQNSNHLEEKKQWMKVLDASIIREKRIEGFQNEIAKLNHELKYYHEAFSSSSSSTDEVIPPKRRRKHPNPQFCGQQQQSDINENLNVPSINLYSSLSSSSSSSIALENIPRNP